MKRFFNVMTMLSVVAALSGCGDSGGSSSGSSSTSAGSNDYVLPAGKSVITFSAYSTAKLSAPISAIDLTITLPQGMSVTTAGGVSGAIENASITAGSALSGTNLAFGNYSISTRKVHLSMTTTSSNYRSGEFLKLLCNVAASPTVTLGGLRTLNSPVPVVKAVGYNATTLSTIVLTDKVTAAIGVAK